MAIIEITDRTMSPAEIKRSNKDSLLPPDTNTKIVCTPDRIEIKDGSVMIDISSLLKYHPSKHLDIYDVRSTNRYTLRDTDRLIRAGTLLSDDVLDVFVYIFNDEINKSIDELQELLKEENLGYTIGNLKKDNITRREAYDWVSQFLSEAG